MYFFWTAGKICLYYFRTEKKINRETLVKSLALAGLSLGYMYLAYTYIFGALPLIAGKTDGPLINRYLSWVIFLMPMITDLVTELAVTHLKLPFGEKNNFEGKFLARMITFPMIALAFEMGFIILIGLRVFG